MSVTFKIIFSEENIRRIKLDVLPSYLEFIELLKVTYPSYFFSQIEDLLSSMWIVMEIRLLSHLRLNLKS